MREDQFFKSLNPHIDKDDIFTVVLHLGFPKSGGDLHFFDQRDKSCIIKTMEFKHGNLNFGCFQSTYHGVDPWVGRRGSFVLNMKESMIKHFKQHGRILYNQTKRIFEKNSRCIKSGMNYCVN